MECFGYLKELCKAYGNETEFNRAYNGILSKDISQIYKIWKNETNNELKKSLLEAINTRFVKLGFVEFVINETGSSHVNTRIKKALKKSECCFPLYKKGLRDISTDALRDLPEYSIKNFETNELLFDCETLYNELCRLSHNNLSGIVERTTTVSDGQLIFIGEHYDKNLVEPMQYMFISCGRYIEKWLSDNVFNNKDCD